MIPKSKTIIGAFAIVAVFVSFLALFSTLALVLVVVGIYWAFQLFFAVGWWAALLVMIGVLALYALALSLALEFIERKTI
jgi:hypothetical protein